MIPTAAGGTTVLYKIPQEAFLSRAQSHQYWTEVLLQSPGRQIEGRTSTMVHLQAASKVTRM